MTASEGVLIVTGSDQYTVRFGKTECNMHVYRAFLGNLYD